MVPLRTCEGVEVNDTGPARSKHMEVRRCMIVGKDAQVRVVEPVDGWHRPNLFQKNIVQLLHNIKGPFNSEVQRGEFWR